MLRSATVNGLVAEVSFHHEFFSAVSCAVSRGLNIAGALSLAKRSTAGVGELEALLMPFGEVELDTSDDVRS